VFKGNLRAMWGYRPQPYPGKITLFASQEQPTSIDIARDPCLGWGAWAEEGVEVHRVPGRHLDVIREPNVRILAAGLSECLARAEKEET
jgi:thioesterase domain-containing protein